MAQPCFSIVLPAYNEAAHLSVALGSIKANTVPEEEYEIVLVDNGSTDGTVRLAREHGVRVIENTGGGRKHIATLRNLGAAATTGELLLFLDADMEVPENWLETVRKNFAGGFAGAMGFVEKVPDDANFVAKVWGGRFSLKREKRMRTDFLPGRNITVSRRTFNDVGGFDDTLETGEDKDFCTRIVRMGRPVISSPEIKVIHHGCEKSLGEFLRKEYWRQNSTLTFVRRSGYTFRSLRNPLFSLYHILMVPALPAAALLGGRGWVLLVGAAWLLPSALLAVRQARRRPSYAAPLFVLTFLRWNVAGFSVLRQGLALLGSR